MLPVAVPAMPTVPVPVAEPGGGGENTNSEQSLSLLFVSPYGYALV